MACDHRRSTSCDGTLHRAGVTPFHQATLVEDRRRLDALRLFSAIEIRAVAAGDEVVVEVDVKETLRLLPYVALSVTDENGLSAGPAFRGINLLGRGSLTSGALQFGGMTMVGARVTQPTVTPGAWALDVGAGYRSRRNELFDFNDEVSVAIAAKAGWNWTDRVQVGGRVEFVWFDTGSSDVSLSPDGTDQLPAVGFPATYNSLDSQSNPRVGWFGSVDIGHHFRRRRFVVPYHRRTSLPAAHGRDDSVVRGVCRTSIRYRWPRPAGVHAVRHRWRELRAGLGAGIARRQEPGNRDSRVPSTPSCLCVRSPCSGATSMAAFRPRRSATSAWHGPTISQPRKRSMAMASACGCCFPSSTSSGLIWLLENRGAVPASRSASASRRTSSANACGDTQDTALTAAQAARRLLTTAAGSGGRLVRLLSAFGTLSGRTRPLSYFSLTLGTGKVAVMTRFCPSVFTRAPSSQK